MTIPDPMGCTRQIDLIDTWPPEFRSNYFLRSLTDFPVIYCNLQLPNTQQGRMTNPEGLKLKFKKPAAPLRR